MIIPPVRALTLHCEIEVPKKLGPILSAAPLSAQVTSFFFLPEPTVCASAPVEASALPPFSESGVPTGGATPPAPSARYGEPG